MQLKTWINFGVIALKECKARQQGNTTQSIAFMEKRCNYCRKSIPGCDRLSSLGVTYFVADNWAAKLLRSQSHWQGIEVRGPCDRGGTYKHSFSHWGRIDEATSLCQQGLNLATNDAG